MKKIDPMGGFDDDTKKLMKQQKELMRNVKDLEPLMSQATKFLKKVDTKKLTSTMDSLK